MCVFRNHKHNQNQSSRLIDTTDISVIKAVKETIATMDNTVIKLLYLHVKVKICALVKYRQIW
jgi:hypothetical protein